MPEDTAILTSDFARYHSLLKSELSYVEDNSFSWNDVVGLLIIQLKNTDSLNKERRESHATQIQLTSERDAVEEARKTEDFFPTLTLNSSFKSWRISIPARVNLRNIEKLGGVSFEGPEPWQADSIQIRRRLLNDDGQGNGNPTLQICYGNDLMPLREQLNVNDYLVIIKRKSEMLYDVFGVKSSVDLGSGKNMYLSERASSNSTSFAMDNLVADTESSDESPVSGSDLIFCTGIKPDFIRNRILFGAPGTGKSYTINRDRMALLGDDNETDYERVTFHPDYSYANFVGTYKPVMVESLSNIVTDADTSYVLSVLNDCSRTAQEKYDLLYERFKDEGLTRLPLLLGLYTDESFKTRKQDGSDAIGDNSVEKNHGRAIRKYVNLITGKEKMADIAYEYVPGPFMRMYVKALNNAKSENPKPFLLIIEEINRANVAAVFGDIFQLLDRDEDGVSEYPIQASEDIKKYLAKELGGRPNDYDKIKIPDNMFIWATMNSADQGVFPMDTAFKRRWDFTYLGIDDSDEKIRGKYVYLADDKSQKVEWNKLRKAINHFLAKEKINEDKQLGPYFISRSIVVSSEGDEIDRDRFIRVFKNKVIMYLFEDAARQKRSKLFEGCFQNSTRYSEICREFDLKGIGIFNHDIQLETEPEEPQWTAPNEEN